MLVAELSQAHNWNLKHPWGKLPFDPMLLLRLEELSSPGVYYNWFLRITAKRKTLLACGWVVGLFVLLLLIYQVLRKGGSCRPALGAVHLCPSAHPGLLPGMPSLLSRAMSSVKPSAIMSDHTAASPSWPARHSYQLLCTYWIWLYYLLYTFLYVCALGLQQGYNLGVSEWVFAECINDIESSRMRTELYPSILAPTLLHPLMGS